MIRRKTHRWDGALVATLALVGFGLLFAEPVLVTAALIPLVYVVYAAVSEVRGVSLRCERTIQAAGVEPGRTVGVRLSVENTGDRLLPDLRIVDGVPGELAVVDGDARACQPLQPGDSVTLSYSLVAKRGSYQFEDPLVEARSLAGSRRVVTELDSDGDETLLCATPMQDSRHNATASRAGTVPTDSGGSGLEFYATRQYSPGDPMNRIDWRNVAKTGEFVTVQYRREQASRTVLVLDCRPVARVTGAAGYPTAVSRSVYAAEQLQASLEEAGVDTSVVAVGLDDDVGEEFVDPDGVAWVDTGAQTGATVEALFRGAQTVADRAPTALSVTAPTLGDGSTPRDGPPRHAAVAHADGGGRTAGDGDPSISRLLSQLSGESAVLLCTPLLDNWPVEFAHALATRDHELTVVSPAVTGGSSSGHRVGSIHRRLRIRTLERTGVRTVDWSQEASIAQLGAELAGGDP